MHHARLGSTVSSPSFSYKNHLLRILGSLHLLAIREVFPLTVAKLRILYSHIMHFATLCGCGLADFHCSSPWRVFPTQNVGTNSLHPFPYLTGCFNCVRLDLDVSDLFQHIGAHPAYTQTFHYFIPPILRRSGKK